VLALRVVTLSWNIQGKSKCVYLSSQSEVTFLDMIYLVRHGKPDVGVWGRINAGQFGHWIKSYNQSTIDTQSKPCDALLSLIRREQVFIVSSLKRSQDSSLILSGKPPDVINAVFCEFEMPYANVSSIRLAPASWAIVFRLAWFLGYSKNAESFKLARARVKEAGRVITAIHAASGDVVLVGHEFFNHFLAMHLCKLGWQKKQIETADRYWSCIELRN